MDVDAVGFEMSASVVPEVAAPASALASDEQNTGTNTAVTKAENRKALIRAPNVH